MKTIYGLLAVMLVVLLVNLLNCAQLKVKEDGLFSKDDNEILSATTGELGYGYSYDNRMGIYNIYSTKASDSDISGRKKKFEEAAGIIEIKKLESLFFKLLRVRDMIAYRIDLHKKKKEWTSYTYLRKYISRPLGVYATGGKRETEALRKDAGMEISPFEKYMDMLEHHIAGRDPKFRVKLKAEELKSIAWVKWYLKYKIEPVDLF